MTLKQKLIEIAGWYGAAAIISAYALVSFSILTADSYAYQLLNLTGAIGVGAISLYKKDHQPAILNVFWALIALIALLQLVVASN